MSWPGKILCPSCLQIKREFRYGYCADCWGAAVNQSHSGDLETGGGRRSEGQRAKLKKGDDYNG